MSPEARNNISSPSENTLQLPTELREGQSFYDQAPFDGALDSLPDTGIPRAAFQYSLSRGCRFASGDSRGLYANMRFQGLGDRLYANYADEKELFKFFAPDFAGFRDDPHIVSSYRYLLNALRDFDLWPEYVARNLERSQYTVDGTYRKQGTRHLAIPTYFAWIKKEKELAEKLGNNSVREVVAEAFPQQLQGTTQARAIRAVGGVARPIIWKGKLTDDMVDPKLSEK